MSVFDTLFRRLTRKPAREGERGYVYQPVVGRLTYDEAVKSLQDKGYRTFRGGVDGQSPAVVSEIVDRLQRCGVRVDDFDLDSRSFGTYLQGARYLENYPSYYGSRSAEKQLEHFLTLELLELSSTDSFIDIASEDSPVPDIFARLSKADTYAQDIQYKIGADKRRIGGDACAIPVADSTFTKAALTCSLEHFETDSDVRVLSEVGRILSPGGMLVVAPLYLSATDATQTDPVYSAQVDVPFDSGHDLFCAENWRNRHGRFYSPETLKRRLLDPLKETFDFRVLHLVKHAEVSADIYLRFILLATRRAS